VPDCCDPSGYRHFFNEREARDDLRRYEKKGLDTMARRIVDYVASRGLVGRSVLEVGGGIGALHVELLKAGAVHAVNVELSNGYERVAAELLEREGLEDRVVRRLGDFTELAEGLHADDVVMNRVVCCYPDMERLMDAALSSSRRFVAATFPRSSLVSRFVVGLVNGWCRVSGIDFRVFVHSPEAILRTARDAGFDVAFRDHDLVWQGVVLERMPLAA
jgi:Methyltransferase domain